MDVEITQPTPGKSGRLTAGKARHQGIEVSGYDGASTGAGGSEKTCGAVRLDANEPRRARLTLGAEVTEGGRREAPNTRLDKDVCRPLMLRQLARNLRD